MRNGRRQDYFQIPLPSSSHAYAGEWFYVRNIGDPPVADGVVLPPNYVGRALVFTGVAPSKQKQWEWGWDKKHANQVDFLLEKINALRRCDLIGAKLVSTFLCRRVQPLWLRRFPMWEYVGLADPDRCSSEELTPEEIWLRLTAITEGAYRRASPVALRLSIIRSRVIW
ncbi:hypothetical protein U9M48_028220 [Paspalum notatum var. saurae]|uniref:Uncharacterized protein n=1 Tax=Paspalum notatum var. saurae TaxID=547442 RepID=A0AAQ3TYS1_PASNO